MLVNKPVMALPMLLLMDVAILAIIGSPVLLLKYLANPTQLGFFCNDESIRHPYHGSTISTAVNMTISYGFPLVLILIKVYSVRSLLDSFKEAARKIWMDSRIFLLGVFSTQMVTGVIKQAAGRLRPHFIEVCSPTPELSDDVCGDLFNPTYVTDYTCPGNPQIFDNDKEEMESRVREGRLSFPSGHASLACFGATFAILYLQFRLVHLPIFPRALLQLLPFVYAFFCCVSRVTDKKHHVTDVLAGGLLGLLFAGAAFALLAEQRKKDNGQRPRSAPSQSAVRLSQVDVRDP